jgi:hypothetical protein
MPGVNWLKKMKSAKYTHNSFYYITGADGTGKSTQATLLIGYFSRNGIHSKRVWLRFPFFFSIPLLAFARWKGYSWHEVSNEVDHGYWDFSRSGFLKRLLPWTYFIDAIWAALWKVYLPLLCGGNIICERFVLDMLVDLSIAFKDLSLIDRLPGRLFFHLIPHNAHIVILNLDQGTVCSRRDNLRLDRALAGRLQAYSYLANYLKLVVIDGHPTISLVQEEILNAWRLC